MTKFSESATVTESEIWNFTKFMPGKVLNDVINTPNSPGKMKEQYSSLLDKCNEPCNYHKMILKASLEY